MLGGKGLTVNNMLRKLLAILILFGGSCLLPADIVSLQGHAATVVFSTGTAGQLTVYNAETQIGLVPNDTNSTVAAANTTKLSNALKAQWTGGSFTFADGTVGPVLKPIWLPPKAFFFKGTIETSDRMGGALIGAGFGYEMIEAAFTAEATLGGITSRMIRIDGDVTTGGNTAVLRIRGVGFHLQGLEIYGRRWPTGEPGIGAVGTKTPSGIEVEGKAGVTNNQCGRPIIKDIGIYECTYGIKALGGYYSSGSFVTEESHADMGYVEDVEFFAVDSCFRSENQQAVAWTFNKIVNNVHNNTPGDESIIFDIVKGGNIIATNVVINHNKCTILQVDEFAPADKRIEIYGFKWDSFGAADDYLTLFKYNGDYPSNDAQILKWSVRMTGHIGNENPTYDETVLFDIPSEYDALFPTWDLKFDVSNMPLDDFQSVDGTWVVPTQVARTIASDAITVFTTKHKVDTESAGATDDLATINGGQLGKMVTLYPANTARTVVIKDGTGNIQSEGDFSMDSSQDNITLMYDGTNWLEVNRANNGS